MGVEQGPGGVTPLVLFLDENHCRNRHMIEAIEAFGAVCEKHLDYFAAGTVDTQRLPLSSPTAGGLCSPPTRGSGTTFLKEKRSASIA